MPQGDQRLLEAFTHVFMRDEDISEETVTAVEGALEKGHLSVKTLFVSEHVLVMKVFRGKGLIDSPHQHDDHESVATLISGRMKMQIGDEEFIAEPGSVWRHPPGVVHYSEALEDCVQIEVKSPPRKTWS